ncbi:hypothetical protein IWQ60_005876 [Tieghemiomyces parasiticus]|uniref:Uncharacterized protein n=1 Tax=Tieghemiomyces parasiticus TaxID=78921 RepID=A0A9W8ABJ1_9FUNG|nr:hypothetical protein IWQ60_005876 [Tieghemiomyces parasiticus]
MLRIPIVISMLAALAASAPQNQVVSSFTEIWRPSTAGHQTGRQIEAITNEEVEDFRHEAHTRPGRHVQFNDVLEEIEDEETNHRFTTQQPFDLAKHDEIVGHQTTAGIDSESATTHNTITHTTSKSMVTVFADSHLHDGKCGPAGVAPHFLAQETRAPAHHYCTSSGYAWPDGSGHPAWEADFGRYTDGFTAGPNGEYDGNRVVYIIPAAGGSYVVVNNEKDCVTDLYFCTEEVRCSTHATCIEAIKQGKCSKQDQVPFPATTTTNYRQEETVQLPTTPAQQSTQTETTKKVTEVPCDETSKGTQTETITKEDHIPAQKPAPVQQSTQTETITKEDHVPAQEPAPVQQSTQTEAVKKEDHVSAQKPAPVQQSIQTETTEKVTKAPCDETSKGIQTETITKEDHIPAQKPAPVQQSTQTETTEKVTKAPCDETSKGTQTKTIKKEDHIPAQKPAPVQQSTQTEPTEKVAKVVPCGPSTGVECFDTTRRTETTTRTVNGVTTVIDQKKSENTVPVKPTEQQKATHVPFYPAPVKEHKKDTHVPFYPAPTKEHKKDTHVPFYPAPTKEHKKDTHVPAIITPVVSDVTTTEVVTEKERNCYNVCNDVGAEGSELKDVTMEWCVRMVKVAVKDGKTPCGEDVVDAFKRHVREEYFKQFGSTPEEDARLEKEKVHHAAGYTADQANAAHAQHSAVRTRELVDKDIKERQHVLELIEKDIAKVKGLLAGKTLSDPERANMEKELVRLQKEEKTVLATLAALESEYHAFNTVAPVIVAEANKEVAADKKRNTAEHDNLLHTTTSAKTTSDILELISLHKRSHEAAVTSEELAKLEIAVKATTESFQSLKASNTFTSEDLAKIEKAFADLNKALAGSNKAQ